MSRMVFHPSEMSQWYALVTEAEAACNLNFDPDIESYLVFLLLRFSKRPEMVDSVLAIEFLNGVHTHIVGQEEKLQALGDKCLIFAGLFPKRANRLLLTPRYFTELGSMAYRLLSGVSRDERSGLFADLSAHFSSLKKTLATMRDLENYQAVRILSN